MTEAINQNQRVLTGRQIQRATGVIALAFVLSAALGMLRNAIISARFGAGADLDAFLAAYRIPETLFTLVAGGALGSAFIPVFARFLGKEEIDGAWRLASAVMTLVAIAGTILAIIVGLFGSWVTATLLIPEASPAQQALTTSLMQIMLCTVVIFGISGLVMGILNAYQHFLTPALAPSMNNIGVILGAIFLTPLLGVYGLAIGAVLGALLHLGVQLPALRSVEPRLRPVPDIHVPGVTEILRLMGPRVLGMAVVQVNFLVNTALTSGMLAGSYTALTFAFTLLFAVLGVLGQSVGTAVFPSLVALGVQEDYPGFRRTLSEALRSVLFMSIPASVGLIVLGNPLVATIYQHGRWSTDDTIATTWALQFFALGLAGFALQEVLARAFYALRDTATPVAVAVAGMLLNVALSLIFMRLIQGQHSEFGPLANPLVKLSLWQTPVGQGPFGGLALANALATTVESAVLWLLLRRRLHGMDDRRVLWMAARVLLAALGMGLAAWFVVSQLGERSPLLRLIIGTAAGGLCFELSAVILGVSEARSVPSTVLRRFRRAA